MKVSLIPIVKINFFCITIALLMGIIYLWIQRGVAHMDYYEVSKAVSLSIFIIVVPDIIKSFIKFRANIFTVSFLTVTVILLLTLLGFLSKWSMISMAKPILIITIFAFIFYLFKIQLSLKQIIITAITGGIFGLIFGLFIWGIDFLSPIFLEKVLYLGKISPDSLMHISLANIFNTYSVPSTGLDGIPYVNYHWGSHVMLASLSNLININVFTFYNLAYPIIFIPLYFKSVFLLVRSISLAKGFNMEINWLFFILLLVFHFRIFYNPQFGLPPATPFNSESYLLGIIFSFLIIDTLVKDIYANKSIRNITLFIIPISIFIISSMKISLGFMFIAAVFYLFFRYKYYRKWNYLIYFFLLAAFFICCFRIFTTSTNETLNIFRPLEIIRWFGIYYIPYYFVLLLLLFLILIFDLKDGFRRRIFSGEYMDLEVLILIAVIGLIPGMVWYMAGNRHFFSDFQYWLSMILFLAYIPYSREKIHLLIPDKRSYKIFKIFIILLFVNIFIRTLNYSGQIFNSLLKDKKEISSSEKGGSLNKIDNQFLKNLEELSLLPLNEKKQSCVYINNSDSLLMDIPENNRFSIDFMVPAITGICMIEGISGNNLRKDFSFSYYNTKKSESRKGLIERARMLGFKKMFEINIQYLSGKSDITSIMLN